jgi:N-acetylglucosaminyl-diphospho-decaprenol L-rhamnosyltransferase
MSEPLLSYCVVNTNGREHVLACLEAIAATHPPEVPHEVLVLDNASDDGSAAAVEALDRPYLRLIALERRRGKAENDSLLLREARGKHCLLLNEDTELQPGAARALLDALEADKAAAAAVAQLLDPQGRVRPCAWRLPSLLTALVGAVFLHRLIIVQSRGDHVRAVEWAQSSALLVRRAAAEEVGYLDPEFFYSEELDFCKRLGDAGWRILYVPGARAVHYGQLAGPLQSSRPMIVEFHRGRDLYIRKHHGRTTAMIVRPLNAWPYLVRAIAAVVLPGHEPRRYGLHARQALLPARGEGMREGVDVYNARRASRNRTPVASRPTAG